MFRSVVGEPESNRSLWMAFAASGVIHLFLLEGLSVRSTNPTVPLQEQLISVDLLEIAPPTEQLKSRRPTEQSKKVNPDQLLKAESKKSPEPKPELPSDFEQVRPLDSTPAPVTTSSVAGTGTRTAGLSLTPSGGLEISEGQRGDIAMVPQGSKMGGEDRAAGKGHHRGTVGPALGEKGFLEAQPLQTVRANYPPMALRMGIEADVILKIQVDTEGKVTKIEIAKSAGMGFDEEALKAVRQFRFEPAQKDGKNVASELTYIYRFRLEK